VAFAVLGAALPRTSRRGEPQIDYLGAALIAAGLSAIVLVASLGGTTWAWGSTQTILVAAIGLALIVSFGAIERRAVEPVLPPRLVRDRVFAVASAESLIVGFAMFGSITFLPLYFQTVDAASPTGAGIRLVPMMVGVLTMSILSGQAITRTGRYRMFPIAGTAVMSVGLLLLSTLDVGTSGTSAALYLLVLGLGLGSVMQVLVLAVQNSVDYSVLGAATSGVTMFRGIGGSLGAAVFGTIFSSRLHSELTHAGAAPISGAAAHGARLTGAQVARLPAPLRSTYEHAYVHALHPVFLAATGVAAAGFALSWLLVEKPLREAAAARTGIDDSLAIPRSPDSLAEIERSLAHATARETRERFAERVAERAGIAVSPGATWALVRIEEHGVAGARAMAADINVDPERVAAVVAELRERGLVAGEDGAAQLTAEGATLARRAVEARRELLCEALADEGAERDPAVEALLHRLARELTGEPPSRAAA
jgi:DNA-binding MarR family transcriptional regulator